jgi:membrane protein YdbS with pleckstrin-like domain
VASTDTVFETCGKSLDGKFRVISLMEFLILGIIIVLLGFFGQGFYKPDDSATLYAITYQLKYNLPYLWVALMAYRFMADKKRCYWFDDQEVSYRVGWLTPSIVTLPSKRLQHVEIKQGALDRLFNLYRVTVLSSGRGFTIPGMSKHDAEAMRSHLLANVVREDV